MASKRTTKDREQWLREASDYFRPWILRVSGVTVPDFRVSMGFSGRTFEPGGVPALAHHHSRDEHGLNQVFISPAISDTGTVLATLLHVMIHVALDHEGDPLWARHPEKFCEYATRLGFDVPFTKAVVSPGLAGDLLTMAAALGPFPHGKLTVTAPAPVAAGGSVALLSTSRVGKPQRNRWVSYQCPIHLRPWRGSATAADEGAPLCGHRDSLGRPCGQEMVRKD